MPYIADIREYGSGARNESGTFRDARDAWIWLGIMRRNHEDEAESYPNWDVPYSGTVDELDEHAEAGEDRTGVVIGPNPARVAGVADQGISYMVTYTTDHE